MVRTWMIATGCEGAMLACLLACYHWSGYDKAGCGGVKPGTCVASALALTPRRLPSPPLQELHQIRVEGEGLGGGATTVVMGLPQQQQMYSVLPPSAAPVYGQQQPLYAQQQPPMYAQQQQQQQYPPQQPYQAASMSY